MPTGLSACSLAYSAWMGLDLLPRHDSKRSRIDGPVPRLRPIVAELCKSTSLSGYHYRVQRGSLYMSVNRHDPDVLFSLLMVTQ